MKVLMTPFALLGLMLISSGCSTEKTSTGRDYDIVGRVTELAPDKSKIKIDHQAIPGYMQAMEMTFKVAGPEAVKDIQVGDDVKGKLRVDGEATIIALAKAVTASKSPDSRKVSDAAAAIKAELAKLDPKDRELAEAQSLCPITDEPLGSMGPPTKVLIKGQPVFLCCKGCDKEATAEPEKTLAKINASKKKK